jgi:transposase InsO family protein
LPELKNKWVEPDVRDEVVDFIKHWTARFNVIKSGKIIEELGIYPDRFYEWKKRYGVENKHNGKIPRSFWLSQGEKDKIIKFYLEHFKDGYRRCAYMMIDNDIVYCSPATVYRVLSKADVIRRWNRKGSKKGNGFEQPLQPHEHWHIDISYVNVAGTFYYLITILDGFSRYIAHTELRASMKDEDVSVVIQAAKERFPTATPRIISDNGKQFLSRDFKNLIRIHGMTHVKTSPYYPQLNGKLERWHKSIKSECIRPGCALTIEDAEEMIKKYIKE